MAQSLIINSLIAKRAEMSGLIADMEDRMVQMRVDLAYNNPAINLAEIKDKQPPHARRSDIFASGEYPGAFAQCSGPLGKVVSADDIVRQTMTDKGLDPADGVLRSDLSKPFFGALHQMHVTESIRKAAHGLGARCGLLVP